MWNVVGDLVVAEVAKLYDERGGVFGDRLKHWRGGFIVLIRDRGECKGALLIRSGKCAQPVLFRQLDAIDDNPVAVRRFRPQSVDGNVSDVVMALLAPERSRPAAIYLNRDICGAAGSDKYHRAARRHSADDRRLRQPRGGLNTNIAPADRAYKHHGGDNAAANRPHAAMNATAHLLPRVFEISTHRALAYRYSIIRRRS
jgi:hypothetical protein